MKKIYLMFGVYVLKQQNKKHSFNINNNDYK